MSKTIKIIEEAKADIVLKHKLMETGRSFCEEDADGPVADRNRKIGLFVLAEGLLADNPPRPERLKSPSKERK